MSIYSGIFSIYEKLAAAKLNNMVSSINSHIHDGNNGMLVSVQSLSILRPVGSIYISTVPTNPGTLFGFGTWVSFGSGKVLVGFDPSDADFNTVEGTGGEKNHTLSITEMPSHNHPISNVGFTSTPGPGAGQRLTDSGAGLVTDSTGGGVSHNNLQPYIVLYFFKRIA